MGTIEEYNNRINDLTYRLDDYSHYAEHVESDSTIINAYDLMKELQESIKGKQSEALRMLKTSQEIVDCYYSKPANQSGVEEVDSNANLLKATITLQYGQIYGTVGFQNADDTAIAFSDPLQKAKDTLAHSVEYFMKTVYIERKDVDPVFRALLPDDFVKRNGIQK